MLESAQVYSTPKPTATAAVTVISHLAKGQIPRESKITTPEGYQEAFSYLL